MLTSTPLPPPLRNNLSPFVKKAFPSEARPLCTPEEKASLPALRDGSGGEDDDDGAPEDREEGGGKTVGELARLCSEDPCRGFLEVRKDGGCEHQWWSTETWHSVASKAYRRPPQRTRAYRS